MKCVTDTSALSWMERIKRLELLTQLYDTIYAPPGVIRQLESHYGLKDFLNEDVQKLKLDKNENRRFRTLVNRWSRKREWPDTVDIEVLITYKNFVDADEMLFANEMATDIFKRYGKTRDIMELCILAEEKGIYNREDSLSYLDILLKWSYRSEDVEALKASLH